MPVYDALEYKNGTDKTASILLRTLSLCQTMPVTDHLRLECAFFLLPLREGENRHAHSNLLLLPC